MGLLHRQRATLSAFAVCTASAQVVDYSAATSSSDQQPPSLCTSAIVPAPPDRPRMARWPWNDSRTSPQALGTGRNLPTKRWVEASSSPSSPKHQRGSSGGAAHPSREWTGSKRAYGSHWLKTRSKELRPRARAARRRHRRLSQTAKSNTG